VRCCCSLLLSFSTTGGGQCEYLEAGEWQQSYDWSTCHYYYYNETLQITQWEPPLNFTPVGSYPPMPVFHPPMPVFHPPMPVFHLPMPVFHLPMPVFHPPMPVFHPPMSVFHPPMPVFHPPMSVFYTPPPSAPLRLISQAQPVVGPGNRKKAMAWAIIWTTDDNYLPSLNLRTDIPRPVENLRGSHVISPNAISHHLLQVTQLPYFWCLT
jgi:hypothetical protein